MDLLILLIWSKNIFWTYLEFVSRLIYRQKEKKGIDLYNINVRLGILPEHLILIFIYVFGKVYFSYLFIYWKLRTDKWYQ